MSPLLGQTPDPKLVKHIRDTIMSYPGVLGVHDLMVHDYGPGRKFASAHAEMAAEASPCLLYTSHHFAVVELILKYLFLLGCSTDTQDDAQVQTVDDGRCTTSTDEW